nr:hypothetical protein [Alkalicoccus saliphilus]
MPMHFPAFASAGRFPGGPASANFFLSMLGRNGSSARPISPRSRLLQLQQENKKKVSLLKNVLIPSFLSSRRCFFLRNVRRGRRWEMMCTPEIRHQNLSNNRWLMMQAVLYRAYF